MTLVKQKRVLTTQKRKAKAEHHRKSQSYVKAYWPYLPMFIILGGSYIAARDLPGGLSGSKLNSVGYTSRAGALVGSKGSWIIYLLYVLIGVLVVWYLSRNYLRISKLALSGEKLLARHYLVDLLIVLVIGGLYIVVH